MLNKEQARVLTPIIDNQGSGNSTIGVGATPTAGEAGFTGNAPQFEE